MSRSATGGSRSWAAPAATSTRPSRLAAWREGTPRPRACRPGRRIAADFTAAGGAAATTRLLEAPDRPTAIIYRQRPHGHRRHVASRRKLASTCRGELSIVGFDDVPLAAHMNPPLTTVRQDVVLWGRVAAAALLSLVDEPAARRSPMLPPSQLVLRASTAPVPERGEEGRLRRSIAMPVTHQAA